ncbi:hypothetical protein Patl1_36319 [Pistacia atlantica]|nr:hypothetical protein Patl1_36319 [Pistacia atlantica]
MESSSFPSAALTSTATSLSRNGLIERPLGYSQFLKFPTSKKHSVARNLKFVDFKAQASGAIKVRSEAAGETLKKADSKDDDLAFVAGATGKVGSRTVRELLNLGYRVRAGVRSAQRAQDLVQSVKRMKLDPGNAEQGTQPVEKLEIVECDLEKPIQIRPALGNASVVLCCIGASEKEVFDITGPYRIDYQATKNLIDAATAAKVNHFIMVSSLGTNKFGFPASYSKFVLGSPNLEKKGRRGTHCQWSTLHSFLQIVRPGGMERPTDAYKETHNITLSQEDTLFGGQVSNLQVWQNSWHAWPETVAFHTARWWKVIAETTAPLTPMEELLAKIPSQRAEPKLVRKEPHSLFFDCCNPGLQGAVDGSVPASLKSSISEKPSAPIEKEPAVAKTEAVKSLSPYNSYEDMKPPTSPTPTPSTTSGASKTSDLDATPAAPISSTFSEPSGTTL